jgi:polyisoprenoid-binding protein YceI
LALVFALCGCGRREKSAAADASNSDNWKVVRGLVSFLLRGSQGTMKGAIRDVHGTLQLDFANLSRSRGTVSMDVASLATSSFEDAEDNQKQTAAALLWLDAGSERNRWATFTIRDVTQVSGAAPKIRAKATGDLTFHGRTTPHDLELEATVGLDGAHPKQLFLQTIVDVPLQLSAHDLAPRDADSALVAIQLAAEPF